MFHLKDNGKSIGSSKSGARDFQNIPQFERLRVFILQSVGILGNENQFQKTRAPFFC